jgi:hypothetical protein
MMGLWSLFRKDSCLLEIHNEIFTDDLGSRWGWSGWVTGTKGLTALSACFCVGLKFSRIKLKFELNKFKPKIFLTSIFNI